VELHFVDPRDLPPGPIEAVTLVDTQAMISVKGFGPATRVHVIDHHPPREPLPPGWTITSPQTGATATLFAEELRERDHPLTTVEATLLLLGIYEDTGSLTYSRTTPRDLNAAGFLLERGASLDLAAGFLNHPLSLTQQAVYDRLRARAVHHTIHGHTVVIACAEGEDMQEELSTVAHKLRDLLDPDALFVLVTTRGGVQLIARSTSDHIDVAEIAEHFGGGGHERAAAGLVKDRDLEGVCQELLENLPRFVRPAVTVAQIMSPGPQLLSPDTPVEEAAERMRHFGYEGYPVVKDGQVIGLLTRRAVDRAVSHRLNKTAASLMEAGQVIIRPDDSIEHLQRLMTDTGWGQVPVVSPQSGEIVGIVTRTDLLKTLGGQPRLPGRQNLAGRLEKALPPARLALLKEVARQAHEQKSALFIVGGFVRDLLLDRPGQDFDLVVEGDAIQLARALARRFGGRVTSHTRFGTAKWLIGAIRPDLWVQLENHQALALAQPEDLPESLDLISARTEFYTHPSALPTVERGSIKLDLHRRDFTINTLALRLDGHHYGELHDYWGGLTDLRLGLVRVLHSLSFVDDPTRMLRAVRFEQRFGFQIEARTLELIEEARPLLSKVSGDRLRHELDHILQEELVVRMLARLQELDLLQAIHPALAWDVWLAERFARLAEREPPPEWGLSAIPLGLPGRVYLMYLLWLIRLSVNKLRQVLGRLKGSAILLEDALAAHHLWRDRDSLTGAAPSQVVSRLEGLSGAALYAAFLSFDEPELPSVLQNYVDHWQHIAPSVDGRDLRRRGLPPGPAYRRVLGSLRDAWLDGKIKTPRQEAELLDRLLAGEGIGEASPVSPPGSDPER
jgi:tRNA nucleotidyltransferase (CCA-adding enzyme)